MRKFINRKVSSFLDQTGKKVSAFDTQRRLDDLRVLRVKDKELPVTGVPAAGDIPDDYMYLINDRTKLIYCDKQYISPNRLIDPEYLHEYIDNYLHKPSPKSPLSDLSQGKIYVYVPDSATVSSILIDYLRKPKPIALKTETVTMLVNGQDTEVTFQAQECELPEHTHDHITELAVEEIMMGTRSPFYQQKVQDTMIKNPE